MFAHGFTFGGHPVAAAVALANLDIFEREDLCEHVLDNEGELPRARSRACATSRSSATCAAPATSTRSSSSRTATPRRRFNAEESEDLLRGFLSGELYRQRADLPRRRPRRPGRAAVAAADRRTASSSTRSRRSCGRRCLGEACATALVGERQGDGHAERPEPARRGRARADRGRARRRRADPLGPHQRAARPDAVAVGRRAAADHRHAADRTRPSSATTSSGSCDHHLAGLGFGTGLEHDARAAGRSRERPSGSSSRCSRSPTRCRSSRSPRRRSRASSTSSTTLLQRGIARPAPSRAARARASAGSTRWRARCRRRSAGPS